jgi:hypothetical protein
MSDINYFSKEEEFLKYLYDSTQRLYSKAIVSTAINITPEMLLEKKMDIEFSKTIVWPEGITYLDIIVKTKSDIFIYLSKKEISELNYRVSLYYEPSKHDEMLFLVNNLKKIK